MIYRPLAVVGALLCASIVFAPLAARADAGEASALQAGLLAPANATLQRALLGDRDRLDPSDVAQANPVGTPQAPIHKPSLPQGFTYNADVHFTHDYGDLKYTPNVPGGMDVGFGYAFSHTNRVQAGYFEFEDTPLGFSFRNVPLYLQGYTGPGTNLPGASLGTTNTGLVDNVTKNKILTVLDQNLITIGMPGGKVLPIVISPTYIARTATIGGNDDVIKFEFNGFPTEAHARTEQFWLLPVTLPFLATPRMFATITAAPQWLVHTAGVNQTNHAQIFLLGYVEYRFDKKTTVFFQPSRLPQYHPIDPYPQYDALFLYGVSHRFTKHTFIQGIFGGGGPTNYKELGITSITCQRLGGPSGCQDARPTIAGLKASVFQLQVGIGSPTVIPL
ncbi:hypothetical protein WPS_25670 [Vulcanimicrobium alpinum]|uniref:Uncharacterized protein n=1 Tax=Vulcanimicrobium alpinum TaxID=3016050 RepID=A0AAN1XXN1_UNVUL|nr:hypothetical protein [Vulcanimicrobium alpinum]BDE07291.1 hypothetical protein WPS_25670 [Vulcanimicrobium alpinum]